MHPVRTILRQATRPEQGPFNILTCSTHERYESSLARTGHNFFGLQPLGFKQWDTDYAPLPPNYTLLDHAIPNYLDIDMVLCQSKFSQYDTLMAIAKQIGVPMISMEHTLPNPEVNEAEIHAIRDQVGDVNVFVSEFNRQAWGYPEDFGHINHTGIDLDVFKPTGEDREGYVLSVVNDWINRDWCCGFRLWAEAVGYNRSELYFPTAVLGKTPGLSRPAESTEELISAYSKAAVYLNTTTISSLPTVIMEAMACGCPVVSTGTCLIPKIMVKHGHNGFIAENDSPEELRYYTEKLLKNKKMRDEMGANARKWVEERFSLERFIDKWNEIFMETANLRIIK